MVATFAIGTSGSSSATTWRIDPVRLPGFASDVFTVMVSAFTVHHVPSMSIGVCG